MKRLEEILEKAWSKNTNNEPLDEKYIEEEKEAPVEPIPLTEEWLIKFGFKKGYNTYYSYLEIWDSLYIVISKYNAIYISESSDINGQALQVGNFEYVHQLQNLYFTLTGKDLELKQPSSGKK